MNNFNLYISQLKDKFVMQEIEIISENEIPYGIQIKLGFKNCLKKDIISLNIYYSSKTTNYKHVIGAKTDSPIKSLVEQIVFGKSIVEKSSDTEWNVYGGSDEAGKGDYFGPLVVAGFVAGKPQFNELRALGVKDSKELNDLQIASIAEKLIKAYPKQYRILKLMPEQYNSLYARFKSNNKNLNHMLAWMHARNIADLKSQIDFEGFIVDQFASGDIVKNSLSELKDIPIIQRTKAESDPCVAAASIIARYHFVKAIEMMSNSYKFTFPKGAGNHVKKALSEFEKKFGSAELAKVAKLHFKV